MHVEKDSCMAPGVRRREVQSFELVMTRNVGKVLHELTVVAAVMKPLRRLSVDIRIQYMLDCVYGESYREMRRSA